MYQAAICEDNPEMLSVLKKTLIDGFKSEEVEMAFDSFTDGMGLLNMINDNYHYDVIFMDIEMPGMDGIEVCRSVKQNNPAVLIVFISNKDELVFQTFEVQPFRFIRKSHLKEVINSLIAALKSELQNRREELISFTNASSGEAVSIDIHKISYIEAFGKKCAIHTDNNSISAFTTLANLEKQLGSYGFIQVHRSYLVNCGFIFHIGKNCVCLTNQEQIPLSRHRVEEVKARFIEYSTGA